MTNNKQSRRMFDRTNSFIISANMLSQISNEEIVKLLVKGFLFCRVTYTKAFNAIYDNIENLTKVEFVKVTVNRMEDTMFKLDFEKVTSLNELAKSYFIIHDVNTAIAAFIYKETYSYLSINAFFYRCSYIGFMSDISGKVTLPLTPKIITIPDEDTLETLRDEYERKQEEAMNIDLPTDYVVEATEDAGYNLLPDNVEEAIIVE
ncbi:hypothetical protein [Bacteroides thetaiotaomicron]|uniref:hypothetical protein n=1 Tax=Bacteroides thetaiotaomicron TaxID=818 RepID=UPI001B8D10BD|nr:hypothetical protein [Bacteroides thetaiotaomicron]